MNIYECQALSTSEERDDWWDMDDGGYVVDRDSAGFIVEAEAIALATANSELRSELLAARQFIETQCGVITELQAEVDHLRGKLRTEAIRTFDAEEALHRLRTYDGDEERAYEAEWLEYWNSLTPQDQEKERRSMDAYLGSGL